MAATLGLVLDCADPDKLAEFWSAAIGYTPLGGAGNLDCRYRSARNSADR